MTKRVIIDWDIAVSKKRLAELSDKICKLLLYYQTNSSKYSCGKYKIKSFGISGVLIVSNVPDEHTVEKVIKSDVSQTSDVSNTNEQLQTSDVSNTNEQLQTSDVSKGSNVGYPEDLDTSIICTKNVERVRELSLHDATNSQTSDVYTGIETHYLHNIAYQLYQIYRILRVRGSPKQLFPV